MPDSQSFATSLSHIEHIRQAAARAALSVTPSQEDQTLQQYLHDNKRIIVSVMRRYLGSNPGLDEDDYLQEALPALRKTVEKWDPRRGHKFTTFFYWYLQKQFTACTTEKNFDVLLFDAEGTLLTAAEDVGRHNAVDKVIGRRLRAYRFPLDDIILVVSSRAGFEIVQKALVARVGAVIAVGAASTLADALARAGRMSLYSFVRGDRFNAHPVESG